MLIVENKLDIARTWEELIEEIKAAEVQIAKGKSVIHADAKAMVLSRLKSYFPGNSGNLV